MAISKLSTSASLKQVMDKFEEISNCNANIFEKTADFI